MFIQWALAQKGNWAMVLWRRAIGWNQSANKKLDKFPLLFFRLVQALAEAGIRIVDIQCGAWHTVALTDEVNKFKYKFI
jgi:hypothetical protein